MIAVSIVITTKDQIQIINRAIALLKYVTDDIVIINNGNHDISWQLNPAGHCRVYQERWNGYAANKNKGIEMAKHDWILSLDADELPDAQLIAALQVLDLSDTKKVYDINFCAYFGDRKVCYGKWGRDHHIRLFNRLWAKWSDSPVHEELVFSANVERSTLRGSIQHYSVANAMQFRAKSQLYARLNARHYYSTGKRCTPVKLYLSPLFSFVKNYIIFLGFLDGKVGWEIATGTFKYTRSKYRLLKKMEYKPATDPVDIGALAIP